MVNFKENYHFSRFLRGSNIFQGPGVGGGPTFSRVGVPIAYSYRKYITCDFPREVRVPVPPLDPHLGLSMVLSIHAENASNLTNRYLGMFLKVQVYRQTDRRVHRWPTPKQYPSDFIGGKPVLSTGYLVSCSRTQRSASGEARTRYPSILGQALYHDCAHQLGSILCRYDTCPTQYAPDLRGSILCMQGTQYAPRESILCMEHFVALQCADVIRQLLMFENLRLTLAKKRCEWECNKTIISENFCVFPFVKISGYHLKVFVFKLNQIHICQTTLKNAYQNEHHEQIELMANHCLFCKRIK